MTDFWKKLATTLTAALIIVAIILVVNYFTGFLGYSFHSAGYREYLAQDQDYQSNRPGLQSISFIDYEVAISNFTSKPNAENRAILIRKKKAFDSMLNRTAEFYGYRVKRWIDLFRVWEHNNIAKMLKTNQPTAIDQWNSAFMQYQLLITSAVSKAYEAFQTRIYYSLLYRVYSMNEVRASVLSRTQAYYQQKVQALIPKNIAWLKKNNTSPLACAPRFFATKTPNHMAKNITAIQYQGRLCPWLLFTRVRGWCQQLKWLPMASDDKKKSELQHALAVCAIANERLQQEAKQAHRRYGELSYDQYYDRYVAPLVPRYKKLLQRHAKSSEQQVFSCDPSSLPQAPFRDPEIDAQTAAYEQYSGQICHAYFKTACDRYAKWQTLKYEGQ